MEKSGLLTGGALARTALPVRHQFLFAGSAGLAGEVDGDADTRGFRKTWLPSLAHVAHDAWRETIADGDAALGVLGVPLEVAPDGVAMHASGSTRSTCTLSTCTYRRPVGVEPQTVGKQVEMPPKKRDEGYTLGSAESAQVATLVRVAMAEHRPKMSSAELARHTHWPPQVISDLLAASPRRPWTRGRIQLVAHFLGRKESELLPAGLASLANLATSTFTPQDADLLLAVSALPAKNRHAILAEIRRLAHPSAPATTRKGTR